MATKEPPKNGLLSKVARFVTNPTTDWGELDKPPSILEQETKDSDRQALKAMIELKRKNDFVRHREFSSLRKLRQKHLGTLDGTDKVSERPSFFQSSFPTRSDDKQVTLKKINEIEAQMSMQWWSTKHAASTLNPGVTQNPGALGLSTLNPPTGPTPSQLAGTPSSQGFASSFSPSEKSEFQGGGSSVVTVTGNSILPIFESRMLGPDPKPGFVNTQTSFGPSAFAAQQAAPASRLAATQAPPLSAEVKPPSAAEAQTPPAVPSTPPTELSFESPVLATVPVLPPVVAAPPASAATAAPAPASHAQTLASLRLAADNPDSTQSAHSEFSSSKGLAMIVEEINHDPDLEEAAIRFANGDYEGAQATLQEALHSNETGNFNEEAWLALFDLFRATGNQTAFESLAIDYAGYFHRSSPQWINLPALIKDLYPTDSNEPQVAAHWKAPVAMGIQSIGTLRAALSKASLPWRLDWSRLIRIEDAALPLMIDLVRDWCRNAQAQFRFSGTEALVALLTKSTPPNHPTVTQDWWHLRMEFLRLFHRPDEFEIVALEFCITYEVSPPSWEPSRCTFKICDANGASLQGGLTIIPAGKTELATDFSSSFGMSSTRMQDMPIKETKIELNGHLQGDPQEALAMLDEALEGADRMVISCEKLIRIDFHAAGALLNWVIARQQEERQVHFVEIHRMILAFFHVIGISEHCLVSVRSQ